MPQFPARCPTDGRSLLIAAEPTNERSARRRRRPPACRFRVRRTEQAAGIRRTRVSKEKSLHAETTANSRHPPGMPLRRVHTTILELETGASDEILHRARYEDLVRCSLSGYTGSRVDGDAAEFLADHLALAGFRRPCQGHPVRRPNRRGRLDARSRRTARAETLGLALRSGLRSLSAGNGGISAVATYLTLGGRLIGPRH
jgi:hypothetical protein